MTSRSVGNVACIGEENLKEKERGESKGVCEWWMIMLKYILRK
jgi:hypothetical protein